MPPHSGQTLRRNGRRLSTLPRVSQVGHAARSVRLTEPPTNEIGTPVAKRPPHLLKTGRQYAPISRTVIGMGWSTRTPPQHTGCVAFPAANRNRPFDRNTSIAVNECFASNTPRLQGRRVAKMASKPRRSCALPSAVRRRSKTYVTTSTTCQGPQLSTANVAQHLKHLEEDGYVRRIAGWLPSCARLVATDTSDRATRASKGTLALLGPDFHRLDRTSFAAGPPTRSPRQR